METKEKESVMMTAEEKAEFAAFREAKAKKAAEAKAKADREMYKQLVDEEIERSIPVLLSRDAKGTLKASRIVQLRKVAEDTGDVRFMEGVRIIEESYQPEVSKKFIRAEVKDKNGMWKCVPLGMTES